MKKTIVFPNWKDKVVYSDQGAQPQILAEDEHFKAIVAGLQSGQKIPLHPESSGVYIFMEGSGLMTVDDTLYAVEAGSTVITPRGAVRGIEGKTRLAFIAVRIA